MCRSAYSTGFLAANMGHLSLIIIFAIYLSSISGISIRRRPVPGEFVRSEKDVAPTPNMVGGNYAKKGQFPWVVSIQATNFEEGWHLCGGTLITPTWALTAAHCLDSEQPEWIWVVTGDHDMSIEEGTEQKLTTDKFHKHPDYVYWKKPYSNDIALVHLSTPAKLDGWTSTLEIPSTSRSLVVGPCYDAGWGASSEGASGSNSVQYIQVPLLDNAVCNAAYNTPLEQGSMCAGSIQGGDGFCVGDNGGPLSCMKPDGSGDFEAGGIMSWRRGCAEVNTPGVYMNTSYYSEWILEVISSEFKLPNLHRIQPEGPMPNFEK